MPWFRGHGGKLYYYLPWWAKVSHNQDTLTSQGLTLRSCHYASGVAQVQEDRGEGWVQEVKVVKTRRLGSWAVILATITEKESTGDYLSHR